MQTLEKTTTQKSIPFHFLHCIILQELSSHIVHSVTNELACCMLPPVSHYHWQSVAM